MRYRSLLFLSSLMSTLLTAFPCPGQDSPLRTEARPDWMRNSFVLSLEADIPVDEVNLPSARLAVERSIATALPALFRERISGLTVDSFTTVGDRMNQGPEYQLRIEEVAVRGIPNLSRMSFDLSRLSMEYRYSIFPQIASLFVRHIRPHSPPELLDYVPSARYTGLIIHAGGTLPVHGTSERRGLTPSLFPRIFDEEMRILLEKEMMDPELLLRQGTAAFTSGTDETPFIDRVGSRPLRTMAIGLFGKNATDPILPAEAARQLLARPENRRLLQEGRILIICDLPEQKP